jgi:hypothetical protein
MEENRLKEEMQEMVEMVEMQEMQEMVEMEEILSTRRVYLAELADALGFCRSVVFD